MRALHSLVAFLLVWSVAGASGMAGQQTGDGQQADDARPDRGAEPIPGLSVTGIATDSAGAPVKGVVVEAWLGERLLGTRITGDDGSFGFGFPDDWTPELTAGSLVVRANRLGYRMVEREIALEAAGNVVLRMAEEPIAIRGLVVESDRPECRIEDQDEARDLWNAMRLRYLGSMDTVGIATYLAEKEALVDRGEIGPLDLPSERRAQRGSSSQLRFSWSRRARRSGYAFPVRRTEMGSSFDSWSYAPLEADFAPHFVARSFGDLHRLRIRDRGDFGWIIQFCPEEPERPSIVGTLRLAPDTTLLEAEWLFRTGDPQENAGGHSLFPRVTGSPEESYPLPRESIFWRRLPTGDFQEIHQRYEKWIVAPGDTVPFLAPR